MLKTKIKLLSERFGYWLSVAILGTILSLSLQLAHAWVAPPTTGTPPTNGSVGAPINTSVNTQIKSGSLNLTGGMVISGFMPSSTAPYAYGLIVQNGDAMINKNLEVDGKLKLPAGAADGSLLTSDASGVASWKHLGEHLYGPTALCNTKGTTCNCPAGNGTGQASDYCRCKAYCQPGYMAMGGGYTGQNATYIDENGPESDSYPSTGGWVVTEVWGVAHGVIPLQVNVVCCRQ